ncbi:hypothetical protein HY625_03195 [Candidatus Uhrbacteria bacterium]|nr:hypothetical protein [Candidatus Uhrbacteria bacterium]
MATGVGGLLLPFFKQAGALTSSVLLMVMSGLLAIFFLAVLGLFMFWIGTTQALFYLALLDGKALELGEALKNGWKRFLGFLWTSVLTGLIVGGGLLLFIVPGIIWGLRYFFAPLLCLSEGVSGRAALRRSAELTHGVRWVLLARGYVVSIIGFVLGLLQLIPLVGPFLFVPFFTTPLIALLSWYLLRAFTTAKAANASLETPYGKGKKFALLLPQIGFGIVLIGMFVAIIYGATHRQALQCDPKTGEGCLSSLQNYQVYSK